jgi:hypothetical protein
VPDKVTPDLADALGEASEDQLLDVVVELAGAYDAAPAGGRAAKVAYMQQSFQTTAAPLEELIRSLGGEILGSAWLNRTIHARVPARAVQELARTGSIAALDRPHELTPERPA